MERCKLTAGDYHCYLPATHMEQVAPMCYDRRSRDSSGKLVKFGYRGTVFQGRDERGPTLFERTLMEWWWRRWWRAWEQLQANA